MKLKAPFPAIGGKSKPARLIWERLDKVDNYIEPFFFSGAVLWANPNGIPSHETVNDLDHYIANFWRAVQSAPDKVAKHADWPVNEVDMHSRHAWLVGSKPAKELRENIRKNPKYFDPLIAGWWVWGQCLWIGSGWCHGNRGANGDAKTKGGSKRPIIGRDKGVHSGALTDARPQLADAFSRGRGVHSNDSANTVKERKEFILEWMTKLSDRLRNTRVLCGDWSRVCKSKSVTNRLGVTGIFMDPPYRTKTGGSKSRTKGLYASDEGADLDKLNVRVRDYCIEKGKNKDIRIALCSYEGEGHEALESEGWTVIEWKSNGYGTSKEGKLNSTRERIWFSPHCVVPERDHYPLFGEDTGDEDDA